MKSTTSYTVGCMGGGGIVLDESGDVVTDGNGNVAVDKSVPYLVGYYSTMMSEEPSCQILFNDGKAREAVGVYVTNFPTAFYDCVHGNGVARPFVNGDKFTLTIHGVAVDQSEKTVDVDLVKYEDGMLQAIRTWKYVDLSPLGEVEGYEAADPAGEADEKYHHRSDGDAGRLSGGDLLLRLLYLSGRLLG